MSLLLTVLGLAVLLLLMVLLVTALAARARTRAIRESPEMVELRERLRRGDIDQTEFERRRGEIERR